MTADQLITLGQIVASIVGTISTTIIFYLRYRRDMRQLEAGKLRERKLPIVGPLALVLLCSGLGVSARYCQPLLAAVAPAYKCSSKNCHLPKKCVDNVCTDTAENEKKTTPKPSPKPGPQSSASEWMAAGVLREPEGI